MSTAVPSAVSPVPSIPAAVRWSLAILGAGALCFLLAAVVTYDPAGIWSQWKAWWSRVLPSPATMGLGLAMFGTVAVLASALLTALSRLKLKPRRTFAQFATLASWSAALLQGMAFVAMLFAAAPVARSAFHARAETPASEVAFMVLAGIALLLVLARTIGNGYFLDDAEDFIFGLVESTIEVFASPTAVHFMLLGAAGAMAVMGEPSAAVATGLALMLPFSLICILAREVANLHLPQ